MVGIRELDNERRRGAGWIVLVRDRNDMSWPELEIAQCIEMPVNLVGAMINRTLNVAAVNKQSWQ